MPQGVRVYNEIYIKDMYQAWAVEQAILQLAKEHPEWGLDIACGAGNWEVADE